MSRSAVVAVAIAAAALPAADGRARQSAAQTFRVSVDAVRVDVLVTDGRRPVGGFTAADFELRDNGVPQRIETASLEEVPLSVMFALDVSGSVRGEPLMHLTGAVGAAIRALKPSDRAALLTFSEHLQLAADWTSDRAKLGAQLDRVTARGGTAINDAAYVALTLRDDATDGADRRFQAPRRALALIFSDGDDTASWLPTAAVLDAARRTDVVVYGVGVRRPALPEGFRLDSRARMPLGSPKALEGRPLLTSLSEETGGQMFYADRTRDLRATFIKIVDEFKSRYLLSYSPRNVAAGGWHAIDVSVKGRKLTVKARRGYQR